MQKHTHTHPKMEYFVCYLSRQLSSRRTQEPLIPPHNAASEANTWNHNAAAAIHAALRMPVHKITMTRGRQKTELLSVGVHADHNNTHSHTLFALTGLNGFPCIIAEYNACKKKKKEDLLELRSWHKYS